MIVIQTAVTCKAHKVNCMTTDLLSIVSTVVLPYTVVIFKVLYLFITL